MEAVQSEWPELLAGRSYTKGEKVTKSLLRFVCNRIGTLKPEDPLPNGDEFMSMVFKASAGEVKLIAVKDELEEVIYDNEENPESDLPLEGSAVGSW